MLGVVVFKNCINLGMCFEHTCMVICSVCSCDKNSFVCKDEFLSVLASLLNFFNIRKKVHTL
jgi:hypothetical protein